MLRGLFARGTGGDGPPDPDRDAARRVRELARTVVDWPDGTAITVSEIECPDPACPGPETFILVMVPGRKTRAAKLSGPARAVTEQALRPILLSLAGEMLS